MAGAQQDNAETELVISGEWQLNPDYPGSIRSARNIRMIRR